MTLPGTGAITHLFSDVEGSTRLWESAPERTGPALARLDALSREVVQRHHGSVVKMTGDGVHAAFDDPAQALAAAVELQVALTEPADMLGAPIAVRCGLHLGVDERRDNDYFGQAVNRAARIMDAAHGGQILVSHALAEAIGTRMPDGALLRDLGVVRLRDLSGSDRLHQVVHPRLRNEFPALRSLASTPNNLPQQLNSFIGRGREMSEVRRLLGEHRLVTVLAMGGIGKSRLSIQLGAEMLDDYRDGVWLVELASITDPFEVSEAVAAVLGVKEEVGSSVVDALRRFVRDRTLLLILDNCEHVVHACADLVKQLLQEGARVSVLATSRDALQIAGECSFQLTPLSVPDRSNASAVENLEQHEAVRLFVDRATAAQPSFRLTPSNAPAVAEICRQLDGIPLAIELAAARTRVLPVEGIATRLNDRFRLLASRDQTVMARQRTLRALIDWSYDLLAEGERVAFRRFSVFAGGWSLEAAEAVAAGTPIETDEVFELLGGLVQKSLVILDPEQGRYRMLETVRQYAEERLAEEGAALKLRRRHLAHFLAFAQEARPQLGGPNQASWIARLDTESDNLLAALRNCDAEVGDAEAAVHLTFALRRYWVNRGLLQMAHRLSIDALRLASRADDPPLRSIALTGVGQLSYFMGLHAEAIAFLGEALQIERAADNTRRVAAILQPLGNASAAHGDLPSARNFLDEAIDLARRLDNRREVATALNARSQLARSERQFQRARPLLDEALVIARELGDHEFEAAFLLNLAMLAIQRDSPEEAPGLLLDVLEIGKRLNSRPALKSALEVASGLAAARGDWPFAALCFGAAEAAADETGLRRDHADEAFLAPWVTAARGAMGEQDFGRQVALGRALSIDAAATEVIQWLSRQPAESALKAR